MPRYFFHVHDGTVKFDGDGVEFSDLGAARREAVLVCGEMLREIPHALLEGRTWFLWVTDQPDDCGVTLLRLTVNMDPILH
jgi:hypothetical protein